MQIGTTKHDHTTNRYIFEASSVNWYTFKHSHMFDIILLIVLEVLLLLLTFGINAFSNIKSLPTIVLPNSVASIYPSAKATSTQNSSVTYTQTTSYSSTTTTTEK